LRLSPTSEAALKNLSAAFYGKGLFKESRDIAGLTRGVKMATIGLGAPPITRHAEF
jgi:hypothetical protein